MNNKKQKLLGAALTGRKGYFLTLNILFAAVLVFVGSPARADHALGFGCLVCHSLRSNTVYPGTRNIDKYNIVNPGDGSLKLLYANFNCATTEFNGGEPLDCSYCHAQGAEDVGSEFNVGKAQAEGSAHPVLVYADSGSVPNNRIYCNDCHNLDVAPGDATDNRCIKTTTDGYPNHFGRSAVQDETGLNARTEIHADGDGVHLVGNYGNATWDEPFSASGAAAPFCLTECHNASQVGGAPDIQTPYEAGGHNIAAAQSASGVYDIEVACYNCHDPHASFGNKFLIVEGRGLELYPNPYNTSFMTAGQDPPNTGTQSAFDGYDDRTLCYSCHSGYDVKVGPSGATVTLTDVLDPNWGGSGPSDPQPSVYPWHTKAHDSVKTVPTSVPNNPYGSCGDSLDGAGNGGCHQVHNTDMSACDVCHNTAPGYLYGNHNQESGPGPCDDCHGFPPIDDSLTPAVRQNAPWEKAQDYIGGGGNHRRHVNLFWKRYDPGFDPTDETASMSSEAATLLANSPESYWFDLAAAICGPCHGDNPGRRDLAPWHNEGGSGGVSRNNVDVRPHSNAITGVDDNNTKLGQTWIEDPAAAGNPSVYYQKSTHDMGGYDDGSLTKYKADSSEKICANLDCHGRPDPLLPTDCRAHTPEKLVWGDTIDRTTHSYGSSDGCSNPAIYTVSMKTAVCKWCHDATASRIVLRTVSGDIYYDSSESYAWGGGLCGKTDPDGSSVDPLPSGVTENYFRTQSGYSWGGHGDAHIADDPTLDPSFIDSAPNINNITPLDCTDCHSDVIADYSLKPTTCNSDNSESMLHFPPYGSTNSLDPGLHRLKSDNGDTDNLCLSCHATYDDMQNISSGPLHHPSQKMNFTFSDWWTTLTDYNVPLSPPAPANVEYDVNPYLSDCSNVDDFVDYWNSPTYIKLPKQGDIWCTGDANNGLSCSTCHNPHGTDLEVDDPNLLSDDHGAIPDNNMLRLRDTDNTLCVACH